MEIKYDAWAFFADYNKHIKFVIYAWLTIRDFIWEQGLLTDAEYKKVNNLIALHDDSKMSKEEYNAYATWFFPTEDVDRENFKGEFKKAVAHHKQANLHHFESLRNYKGPWWRCYIIEMICDYIAMGWKLGHFIFEYYDEHKEEMGLPKEYQEYLDKVLGL